LNTATNEGGHRIAGHGALAPRDRKPFGAGDVAMIQYEGQTPEITGFGSLLGVGDPGLVGPFDVKTFVVRSGLFAVGGAGLVAKKRTDKNGVQPCRTSNSGRARFLVSFQKRLGW